MMRDGAISSIEAAAGLFLHAHFQCHSQCMMKLPVILLLKGGLKNQLQE
jgi:hypothetical protein